MPNISQKSIHDNSLRDLLRPMIMALLPDMPYAIGTLKDVYYKILPDWPGSKKRLRRTIEGIMYSRCHSYSYQEALFRSRRRHGIDGRIYPLDEKHRQEARQKILEITEARKAYLKALRKKRRRKR